MRAQLHAQHGGADVAFDEEGRRVGGARLLAVVTVRHGKNGRHYRLSQLLDYEMVGRAHSRLQEAVSTGGPNAPSPVPDEALPAIGTLGFRVQRYGMLEWGDLFTVRQKLALLTFTKELNAFANPSPASTLAALSMSKMVDMNNDLATWQPHAEIPAHMLTRFAIPMKWDFAESRSNFRIKRNA